MKSLLSPVALSLGQLVETIVCKPEAEEEYVEPKAAAGETSSEDGPVKEEEIAEQGVAEAVEMDEEDEIHV